MLGISDTRLRITVVAGLLAAAGTPAEAGLGDGLQQVLRRYYPGLQQQARLAPAPEHPAPEPARTSLPPGTHRTPTPADPVTARTYDEYVRRIWEADQRETHRWVQAGRRAALDEFRQQIRLNTPEALAAARATLKRGGGRPEATTAAAEVYGKGEAAARTKAIAAADRTYRQGLVRAKAKALAVAKEYAAELDDEARKEAIKAMLAAYKAKGADRAQRASRDAHEVMERMKAVAAAKVAVREAQVLAAELEKAEQESQQAGFAVYRQGEEEAYQLARAGLEADRFPGLAADLAADPAADRAADPGPRADQPADAGLLGQ